MFIKHHKPIQHFTPTGSMANRMETKFVQAASKGNADQVSALIEQGVNVNCQPFGITALCEATRNGHLDCVKHLVSAGADIHFPSNHETPFMMALKERVNGSFIEVMLQAKNVVQNYSRDKVTTLMCAAIGGYLEPAFQLISQVADVQEELAKCDASRNNVLTHAAINGHVQFLRELVLPRYTFPRAILRAIANEDVANVKQLLKSADNVETFVNFNDTSQLTPLSLSVILDNVEITKVLLRNKANPDTVDASGRHALMYAAACGSLSCLKLLIFAGSTTSWVDRESKSALIHAAANGHTECLDFLIGQIRFEADAKVINENGEERPGSNKLAVVAQKDGYCAITFISGEPGNGRLRVTRANREAAVDWGLPRLINNSMNQPDSSGMTALKYACKMNHRKCVRLLLGAGVEPDTERESNMSPLSIAAQAGYIGIAEELCDAKADIDKFDLRGYSALFHAVSKNRRDSVQFLIDRGASLEKENSKEETVFSIAALKGFTEMLKCLLGYSTKYSKKFFEQAGKKAFVIASKNGDTYILWLLLHFGLSISTRDNYGYKSVLNAVEGGHTEAFMLLVRDLNVQQTFRTPNGGTLMSLACTFDVPLELMKFLTEWGVPVDRPDVPSCISPLMVSCAKGNEQFVRLLLGLGASTPHRDIHGNSAIVYAARGGSGSCVKTVIEFERARKLEVNDAVHKRAFLRAVGLGNRDCVAAFIETTLYRWQWFYTVLSHPYADLRMLLSCLVTSSISPYYIWIHKKRYSPLKCALLKCDFNMAKYLLVNLYLTEDDYREIPRDQRLCERVVSNIPDGDMEVVDTIFRRPWPLATLSLLTISTALTTQKNLLVPRSQLVTGLPLPDAFKRRLSFSVPTSKVCPAQWQRLLPPPDSSSILNVSQHDHQWAVYPRACHCPYCYCHGEEGGLDPPDNTQPLERERLGDVEDTHEQQEGKKGQGQEVEELPEDMS